LSFRVTLRTEAEVDAIRKLLTSWGHEIRQHWRSHLFQLKIFFCIIATLAAIGVAFYRIVLHWPLRAALLQLVLILSTLGGEAHPNAYRQANAQWFHIFFIGTMTLTALWGVSVLVQAMVSGELMYFWGARRMEQRINQLSNHFVICGFGRMGQEIARIFTRAGQPFVVIEHNPVQIPGLTSSRYLFVQGDEREDEQLLKAGIKRAKGLVTVAASDEDNVYITLSARVLNPELYIVTRCVNASGEAKLLRAGANRVVSPYIIGGRRMAQAILRPTMMDFLDMLVQGGSMELTMEAVTIVAGAPACGHVLQGDYDVEQSAVHVLGITTASGQMLLRELDEYPLAVGDTLILLGAAEHLHSVIKQLLGNDILFNEMAPLE